MVQLKYSLPNINFITGFKGNKRLYGELPPNQRLSGLNNRSSTPSISTRSTTDQGEMKYSYQQYRRIKHFIKTFKLRSSTRKSYKKMWNRFNKFISQFDIIPPKWEDRIIVWATHLADNRRKSATIRSYISAIRYCLGLDGITIKHENCELAAIIQAAKQENDRLYIRLPIQRHLIQLMLRFIDSHYIKGSGQIYQGYWLKAIFSMAYHGMMRISELAEGPHAVRAQDIIHAKNKQKCTIYLRSSKTHSTADQPQIINIPAQPTWFNNCPVRLITTYANLRGRYARYPEQPFFINKDGSPITPLQFRTNLKFILFTLGLPSELYGSHSFRSGKATDEKLAGKSVRQIKDDGRWSSSTVYKYIRAQVKKN